MTHHGYYDSIDAINLRNVVSPSKTFTSIKSVVSKYFSISWILSMYSIFSYNLTLQPQVLAVG
jgi:hypothetical protein